MEENLPSLLRRLRQPNSAEAWERFVPLYSPLLFFWACRAGLQAQDAADLVQDVFVTLLQKLPEFDTARHVSFRAWLRTITFNKWRDHCRRKAVAGRQGNAAALDDVAVPDGAQAVWEAEYQQYVLRRALEVMETEFPAPAWKSFCGLVLEGRPAATIAAELGITPVAVYSAKARVLRRLRQELDGLLE